MWEGSGLLIAREQSLTVSNRCLVASVGVSLRTAVETVRDFDTIAFINKCIQTPCDISKV